MNVTGANGNWIYENATTTEMAPTVGYAVRAPQTFSSNPLIKSIYTSVFNGTPNNGNYSAAISVGIDANVGTYIGSTIVTADDDQWNLIGNPYPSAIDI